MAIHTNTYCFKILGWKYAFNTLMIVLACIDCISMYFFCQYMLHTCNYKPIQTQYTHDGAKTCGRWGLCICMYLHVFCMYYVCIDMYLLVLGALNDHRFLPRCIACIACIGMYLYVFSMYLYVFSSYIQAVYKRIRTYRPIQIEYKHRIYVCIVYVECMYHVCICVYWFWWHALFLGIDEPDGYAQVNGV